MTEVIIAPGANDELVLDDSDLLSVNPVKEHTAVGDARIQVAYNREIDDHVRTQDRVNIKINGTIEWTGFAITVEHDERQIRTTLTCAGIAKRLEETRPDYDNIGGSVSYSDIKLEDAIDDYWGLTPFSATVYSEPTQTVATDERTQFADFVGEFGGITDIPADKPAQSTGSILEVVQASWVFEAENTAFTGTQITTTDTGTDYSNFEAVRLSGNGDRLEDAFSPNYDIPAGELQARARFELNSFDGEVFLEIDGNELNSTNYGGTTDSIDWRFSIPTNSNQKSAGDTVNVNFEVRNYNSGNVEVDIINVRDRRFTWNEDNTVDTNFFTLEGPELYPTNIDIDFSEAGVSYNITDATIDITEQDGETINEVAISADSGGSYQTQSNTNDHTFTISADTRSVKSRIGIGGYQEDTTTTPTERDEGHKVDVYELLTSGNDLTIIDELELSRSHFQNLQQLHNYGDYIYVIQHSGDDIGNLTVESFSEGDQTMPKPSGFDDKENQQPEITGNAYYNTIFVQGRVVNNDRPAFEAQDDTAVTNDGREISPGTLRDTKITTEAGAAFRARVLLNRALNNDVTRGSVTVSPSLAHPGYARPVDFGDGENELTVERVEYVERNGELQAQYQFSRSDDLAEQINELQRNTTDIGDAV